VATPVTISLIVTAVSCILLGGIVVVRNPRGRTERAFAVMTLNILLWALGVLVITHTHTERMAEFWVRVTFCVSVFLPATFLRFIGYFPSQRFDGPRWLSALLYVVAAALAAASFLPNPLYIRRLEVFPDAPPILEYGVVFHGFAVLIALGMFVAYPNLIRKFREASGIARRQIEHVLLGIVLSTVLATATNVIGPLFEMTNTEPFGPVFMVVMVAFFSYAMARYHLMDIWDILSRLTMYVVGTAIVILTFLGAIALVSFWLRPGTNNEILPTVVAAIVIAVVLQPIRERVQLILNRTILKRRYDINLLLARASRNAATLVQLDELLSTVCGDIQQTVGVDIIRVLLVDEHDPNLLVTEYSTLKGEQGRSVASYYSLFNHLKGHPEPLILDQLVHAGLNDSNARLAHILAEQDVQLCLPLRSTSNVIGILALGPKTSRDIYTVDDVIVFTALATPLASAIGNARLYRELEEANLHRERLLSNMRGGVVAVDTEGEISTINQAAKDILGSVPVGASLKSLTPRLADVLARTLKTGQEIRDFETMIAQPGGSQTPVVMSSACLTSADSEVTGAMVMVYDLTHVKHLQQNMQRAHRLSSVGNLAAGMAHEIKNPLVSIKTFSQLLLSRYDDPEFRTTFADIVPTEVDRIDSIVARLLDFARPKQTSFSSHSLRDIIEDVLTLVENQTRKACISVSTALPDEAVLVYGDEQQLHQVFLNLVLNAIDAMEGQGEGVLSIEVTRSRMRQGGNRLVPMPLIDCVEVCVSDTGCGIVSESLDRVFTPFYTTKETGTGLGLSVVHGIVTDHGGAIDVQSVPGEGARFTISLPLESNLATAER
jgi:signal transduction histidine kinase